MCASLLSGRRSGTGQAAVFAAQVEEAVALGVSNRTRRMVENCVRVEVSVLCARASCPIPADVNTRQKRTVPWPSAIWMVKSFPSQCDGPRRFSPISEK